MRCERTCRDDAGTVGVFRTDRACRPVDVPRWTRHDPGRGHRLWARGNWMRAIGLSLVFMAAGAAPALAQIRVDEARIVSGDLRVSGRAKPNATVTFDERHETK